MNNEFYTISQYVESKCTVAAKIVAYDNLISAMELAVLKGIESGYLTQAELNDGQMIVKTTYRSITDMTKALNGLEAIRQRYINRYNGRCTVLRGGNL